MVTSDHLPDRVTGKDGKSYPARRPVPQDSPPATLEKSRAGVTRRLEHMREMAAKGYSSRQMATELGIGVETCYRTMRQEGIRVLGDDSVKGTRRIDPARYIENTTNCADAEAAAYQYTESIDFGSVDRELLITCIGALRNERRVLGKAIRRLESFVG